MDPKLDELVNCIQALEAERKLSPLHGRILHALWVEPQSHLVGAFQDCILLYNECFMTTWTVDEEYLKQLEQIIRPWFTYWTTQQGYELLPRTTVDEIRGRYSLGSSALLPMNISKLLNLECLTVERVCDPGIVMENYLGILKSLQSGLGQTLFDIVFSGRLSNLSYKLSLLGYGAAGASKTRTQSMES